MKRNCVLVVALIAVVACRRVDHSATDVAAPVASDVRWQILPLAAKQALLRGDDLQGKAALERAIAEEQQWSCLARRAGIADSPAVRARTEEATRRILFEELLRSRAVSALLTEADVVDAYQKGQIEFSVPEEVRVSHILATGRAETTPPSTRADDAKSEAEATAKMERLRATPDLSRPEVFAELARSSSEEASAAKGGDLGWIARGTMVPEFDDAVFAGKVGEVLGPIRTEFGLHLVRIAARRGGQILTLDEVRRDLEDRLLGGRRKEMEAIRDGLVRELAGCR